MVPVFIVVADWDPVALHFNRICRKHDLLSTREEKRDALLVPQVVLNDVIKRDFIPMYFFATRIEDEVADRVRIEPAAEP